MMVQPMNGVVLLLTEIEKGKSLRPILTVELDKNFDLLFPWTRALLAEAVTSLAGARRQEVTA